jgi:hypothetical protein
MTMIEPQPVTYDVSTPLRISASQIKLYRSQGPRAWWFKYCHGRKEETTEAMLMGSMLHKEVEYRKLQVPNPGTDIPFKVKQFATALQRDGWLEPLFDEEIEPARWMALSEDVHVLCYTDVEHLHGVRDWKTTADARYAMKEDDMLTDPQMIIEVASLISHRFGGQMPEHPLYAELVYVVKKKPFPTFSVCNRFTEEIIRDGLAGILRDAVEMKKLRDSSLTLDRFEDIPCSVLPDSCRPYRRECPHLGICSGAVPVARNAPKAF